VGIERKKQAEKLVEQEQKYMSISESPNFFFAGETSVGFRPR